MKRRIRGRGPDSETLGRLWNAIQEEWENIAHHAVVTLIRLMKNRMEAVVRARGGNTSYWINYFYFFRLHVLFLLFSSYSTYSLNKTVKSINLNLFWIWNILSSVLNLKPPTIKQHLIFIVHHKYFSVIPLEVFRFF